MLLKAVSVFPLVSEHGVTIDILQGIKSTLEMRVSWGYLTSWCSACLYVVTYVFLLLLSNNNPSAFLNCYWICVQVLVGQYTGSHNGIHWFLRWETWFQIRLIRFGIV